MSRAELFAHYILDNKATIRKTAVVFDISKSTVHNDISKKLPKINNQLYFLVQEVLEVNFNEKHIRGGVSTKNKFLELKKRK